MIAFRVDANEYVATGHMMRCISIAKKCQKIGQESIFLLAEEKNTDLLKKKGIDYYVLNVDWNDWNSSIYRVQDAIKEKNIHVLFVDSYLVTYKFLDEINKKVPTVYMDDMCKGAYNVTGVIHYSQWAEEKTLEELYDETQTEILSGMDYMPLREEFENIKYEQQRKKQILITTGGTDPFHATIDLAEQILQESLLAGYNCIAVLGKMNKDTQKLEKLSQNNKRLQVYQNVSNISKYMKESAIAVSAGGTSIYELCACETPCVCISFSEDQIILGEKMDKHNVLYYAGDVRKDKNKVEREVIKKICMLVSDEKKRWEFQKNMKILVDGKGAERIARYLCKFKER